MGKPAVALLGLCTGLAAGLLLGYLVFREGGPAPSAVSAVPPDTSAAEHFFYRATDSTLSRHTVRSSGNQVVHTVDTIPLSRQ